MMREIKFRVWNKPLGQYIDRNYNKDYFISFEGILCSFNDFGLVLPLDMKNYILEQYTGLKDKNGVEIYENDIIKSEYWNGVIKYISDLGYDYVGWYVVEEDEYGDSPQAFDSHEVEYFEVVGNIHEVKE